MSESVVTVLLLVVTVVVSAVTLITGFGIGSVLTPTFALFYDAKLAVVLVSIVHLSNNVLKIGLFHAHLDKTILKRFGLVSILGALVGSSVHGVLDPESVGIVLGLFLLVIGGIEFLPSQVHVRIPRRLDYAGGLLSGLMGGLIGNQGAVRSGYLLNYPLSKEAFIATGTSISLLIDLTRIPVYLVQEVHVIREAPLELLLVVLFAFAGTLLGRRLLKKLPHGRFRRIVAAFVVVVAIRLLLDPLYG